MKRKILLISKSPRTGGAAIASRRLLEALRSKNANVKMLVQEGADEKEEIFSTTGGRIKEWINLIRFIWERLVFIRKERSKSIRFLFSLANTGESLIRNRHVTEADVIHLHWINAGFLSLRSLSELLQTGKPMVWTFHDMWPFTGGCHYALDCKEYTRECGSCPYLKKPGKGDLSHRIWKKKERLFRNSEVTVITPSDWLQECVRASSLLRHWKVLTIPNPVDPHLFAPVERKQACLALGLDPSKKYILFGAATMKNVLKGFSYFQEAIRILAEDMETAGEVEILLFGKTREDVARTFPLPARNIAFVQSVRTMVELYSAAHLFAIPSLQDNLPNTILESMLCGTPVVGFRTGGIPGMIAHRQNGYLASCKSSGELAEGIKWVLSLDTYEQLSAQTRQMTLERFSMDRSVEMHLALYSDLLKQKAES
ncbi:MAG: glycosyltransferase [Bacteroidales bacterium]|nr:glycosyltransferase [Bacteroidales bacterium]